MTHFESHTYISQANVLDKGRVEIAALVDLLEELVDNAVKRGVLEATLARLGEGGAHGEGDDDVVGVLLLAGVGVSNGTGACCHADISGLTSCPTASGRE